MHLWFSLALAGDVEVRFIEFDDALDTWSECLDLFGCESNEPHWYRTLPIRRDFDEELEHSTALADERPTGLPRPHRGWR